MPRNTSKKRYRWGWLGLPPSCATTAVPDLEIIQLGFKLLDGTVGQLKVLVQPVPLCDELWNDNC